MVLPAGAALVTDACLTLGDAHGGATYDGCFLDRATYCPFGNNTCGLAARE